MHRQNILFLLPALLFGGSGAREIHPKVKSLYKSIVDQRECRNKLASGLYSSQKEGPNWSYCGDHISDSRLIYAQGINGNLANMDVDCDGIQQVPNSGRCGNNDADQPFTSFQWIVEGYDKGVTDLDPYRHNYVVFGNSGNLPGYVNFDPKVHGIEPLSIMIAVSPNRMVCGIWGDGNGGERAQAYVGEASIAMGDMLIGDVTTSSSGYDRNDILYLAFQGVDAVPGPDGAKWDAADKDEFARSIDAQCDRLIERIGSNTSCSHAGGGSSTTCSGTPCELGHGCASACCSDDDCAGDMACASGKCVDSCDWKGHCTGYACKSSQDCSKPYSCKDGHCA